MLPDYPEGMDIWHLMKLVHNEEDKRRWPEVKARAESVGVSTRGKTWKDITRVSLDYYAECHRRELERMYPA